jgi:hypothetical protein
VTSKSVVVAAVAAQLLLFVGAAYAGGETVRVPEPTTMGLIGVGAAVMALRAWRKHGK